MKNITLSAQTICERISACAGWEAKSRLLVQLSREMPTFPETDRCETYRVAGCESQVWLKLAWHDGLLDLAADSDSRIIKGLLVLVYAAFQGHDTQEIRDFDFDNWMVGMGLSHLLTTSRSNGLKAIVARIRSAQP